MKHIRKFEEFVNENTNKLSESKLEDLQDFVLAISDEDALEEVDEDNLEELQKISNKYMGSNVEDLDFEEIKNDKQLLISLDKFMKECIKKGFY